MTENIRRIDEVKFFLMDIFPNRIQIFNSRNVVGDSMYNIYDKDDIKVDYCHYYEYIEVFGVTEKEYKELTETCGCNSGEYEGN